jgi:predicted dehydrogenase
MLQPFAEDEVTLEVRRDDELVSSETETANRYGLEVDNFARAIAGEEPPLLDRRDSIGQARALDALLRSAESAGTAVTV